MTTLITGGFIGSFLARHLIEMTNEELILYDFVISEKRIKDLKDNSRVEIIQGDLSNWSELKSFF